MDESRRRILYLLDQLDVYLKELEVHLPKSFSQYEKNLEKKRFCERTLQLMIEICINISQLLVKGLKLGLPTEEESIFEKLEQSKVISPALKLNLAILT